MATTGAEPVFLDTNVLLTAVTPARRHHAEALRVLNDWPSRGVRLCASHQVLREWMVVATRPPEVNGLGLSLEDAMFNVRALSSRLELLNESPRSFENLLELIAAVNATGKQIHDAQIVVTALAHRVRKLLTANAKDFARYGSRIEVLDLGELHAP